VFSGLSWDFGGEGGILKATVRLPMASKIFGNNFPSFVFAFLHTFSLSLIGSVLFHAAVIDTLLIMA
jgi:hypothetical protein